MTESSSIQPPDAAVPPPSFEAALARLETVVHELEEGRIGLAEALSRYEEGVKLLRQCFGLLESAERQIELLTSVDAAGNPIVEPFDDTASTERAEQGMPRSRSRTATTKKTRASGGAAAQQDADPSNSPAAGSALPDPTSGQSSRPNKMDVPRGLF